MPLTHRDDLGRNVYLLVLLTFVLRRVFLLMGYNNTDARRDFEGVPWGVA